MKNKAKIFTTAGLSLLFSDLYSQKYEFKDTKDFIKKYQSAGTKINRDSVLNLPIYNQNEFYNDAKKRDIKIEIDTIIINKISDSYYNFGLIDRAFNMISLKYYIVSDNCDCSLPDGSVYNIKEIKKIIDKENSELPYNFIHEMGHYNDLYLNIGALSISQLAQFEFNSELRARINVIFYKNPKIAPEELIKKALGDMDENFEHYANNRIPDLIKRDVKAVYDYQINYIASKRKSPGAEKLDQKNIDVKSFDDITRLQYTFNGVCLLDSLKKETIDRLFMQILKYVSAPGLNAAIKDLNVLETDANLMFIRKISGITKEQKYDVNQRFQPKISDFMSRDR